MNGYIKPPAGVKAGFTLVEVLVTIVVIAIGVLAAVWLQSAAMRGNSQADQLTVASFLSESEIERLRSMSYAQLEALARENNGKTVVNNISRSGEVCPTAGDCEGYPYSRTVYYYSNQPTSRSHRVEVVINWADSHGQHARVYDAAITDYSF